MIPVNELIRLFQRMNSEHWPYVWGSAKEGEVDCSGAFVWAYRQFGESIYHGSNRIARKYVLQLLPVSMAQPGMAAFKLREPGEEYYALPQGYMSGGAQYNGDLNDYHHIGLVDEDPRYVLNAKSTADGFKRSPITEDWDCVAYLEAVEYDEQDGEPMYEAVVIADSGSTVRMRKQPTTDSPTIVKVPLGETVQVNESAQGWAQIEWNGNTGYMMTKYLKEEEDTPPMTLETRVALLEEIVAELQLIVEGGVG